MTGRQEHDIWADEKAESLLCNESEMLKRYFYAFTDKTNRTKLAYIKEIILFVHFFEGEDITKFKKSDISRYMEATRYRNGKELTASTRNVKLAAIKHFYNFLVDDGYIENNPALGVNRVKQYEEKEIVALTPVEIRSVAETIINSKPVSDMPWDDFRYRDLAIFMLGCTTGLRVSAITEIDVEDVDFENNTIRVTEKGNKIRTVNVGQKTMDAIKKWMPTRRIVYTSTYGPLFTSAKCNRMSTNTVRAVIAKYTKDLSKHITPHKMRSSCATNLYEQTGDIYLVQQVLGHRNIANTMRYARASASKRKAAVELMDSMF